MLSISKFIANINSSGGLLNPTRYKFTIKGPIDFLSEEQSFKISSVP